MELVENSQVILSGATWKQAILAVSSDDYFLVPGFSRTPETWKELVSDMGLVPEEVIFSATHSLAGRHVEFMEEKETYFLQDPDFVQDPDIETCEAGWHVLTKSNLKIATWESDSSSITIERRDDGLFDIIGLFPIEDGSRYEGYYYQTMMRPIEQAKKLSEFEELCNQRYEVFVLKVSELVDNSEVVSLPGFQDWSGPVDPEPFETIAGRFEMYAEELEITIDEFIVKALVFVGASDWDEWYHYRRDELVAENPGVEFPDFEPLFWGVCQIA